MLRKVAMVLGVLVALAVGGLLLWASHARDAVLAVQHDVDAVGFPIPWPAGVDGDSAGGDAESAAVERGRHLAASRYTCTECHANDFAGGPMADTAAFGRWFAPNLTTGGPFAALDAAGWDRAVRLCLHGDGSPMVMPCEDYAAMTDQELSDLVAYIRSLPASDKTWPPLEFGPVSTLLLATGTFQLSIDRIGTDRPRPQATPPVGAGLGEHLAKTCAGCHRRAFEGGPMPYGDPAWPPASNLTPHAEGLAAWSFEQFDSTMRSGVNPEGRTLAKPMSLMPRFHSQLTPAEMRALWGFLRGVEARPTGA